MFDLIRSSLKKLSNGFNPSLNDVTTLSMLVRYAFFLSGLALSHSLLVDYIAFTSSLKKLFNGFNPSLNDVTTVSNLVRYAPAL